MRKWALLLFITFLLIVLTEINSIKGVLHDAYLIMVIFFAIQAFVLLRIEILIPEEWKVHASLVKIIIRFMSSAVFILILIYQYEKPFDLVIQFICLYLVYMTFEIGVALTNLRRN